MRIAKVVGTVTLSHSLRTFDQATLRLVEPLDRKQLKAESLGKPHKAQSEETLVAWDLIGVGSDSLVAISEGPEASMPFRPQVKPIDASVVALLDHLVAE